MILAKLSKISGHSVSMKCVIRSVIEHFYKIKQDIDLLFLGYSNLAATIKQYHNIIIKQIKSIHIHVEDLVYNVYFTFYTDHLHLNGGNRKPRPVHVNNQKF